jgi:hypothetical protein
MVNGERGPVFLAEALEQLLSTYHDKYLIAAAARLYPKTIHNIIMRRPVSQVTLDKVARALQAGKLSPRDYPPADSANLSGRLYHFLVSRGGTVSAAAQLKVDPIVLAKLIYERKVNSRFRMHVMRRLEQMPPVVSSQQVLVADSMFPVNTDESLAECLQAYELYKVHGTLEAVGRKLDLSRERVRQLINRGVAYGVIPATPHYTETTHPFPFSTREEFLTAYRQTPSLTRLVRDWHISKERLKRFCLAHAVTPADLECIRRAARDLTRKEPCPSPLGNIVNM